MVRFFNAWLPKLYFLGRGAEAMSSRASLFDQLRTPGQRGILLLSAEVATVAEAVAVGGRV